MSTRFRVGNTLRWQRWRCLLWLLGRVLLGRVLLSRVLLSRVLLSGVLVFGGCRQAAESLPATDSKDPSAMPAVFVVNYPLAYFVRRLGEDSIHVRFPAAGAEDPAFWEPDDAAIEQLQAAQLLLLNGADYAKWTLRTSLPWSRTVITTSEVEERYIKVPNVVTHSHGPEGEHSHAGIASETWLDTDMAISQAAVVKQQLQKLLPDSAAVIETRFEALEKDLRQVDAGLKKAFESAPPGVWMGAQPAFSYLGRRYGLKMTTFGWQAQTPPLDAQWQLLEKLLDKKRPAWMLWKQAPQAETLARLEKIGVRVVVFDCCEKPKSQADYLRRLNDNVARIQAACATAKKE